MGAQAPRLANDRRLRHPPPMRLREKNVRPRVLRTGNYSTPVLSEICLPVEHLPAGIRWPAARLCRNVCTSSYFCRSRPPLPLTVLGTATMDLSTSQFNVGGTGECAGRMQAPCQDRRQAAELWNPVAAHLLCLGAVCAVCAPRLHFCTSAFHLLCPSSPSGSYHPGIHLRRYHGESLSRKGTYLIKSDKKVKMSIQGTKKNNH